MLHDEEPASEQPLVVTLNDLHDVDWALRYLDEGIAIEAQTGFTRTSGTDSVLERRLGLFALLLDRVDRSRFEIVDLRPRRNTGPMRHVRPPELCTIRPIDRLPARRPVELT